MRLVPVEFKIDGAIARVGHGYEIRVVQRKGFNGVLWAVEDSGFVLRKDGAWEWEPQPSSRTGTFLSQTRYTSPEEALAAFERSPKPPVLLPLP